MNAPRVAFQGEAGAFSEEAVYAVFGAGAMPLPCREFRAVGAAVADGSADAGLLPVENSVAGSVVLAYDVLAATDVTVIAEVVLPIRHFLLAVKGASLDTVRRVYSHPVALAQCTRFLASHAHIEAIAVHDTAGAAREVADAADPTRAAIAPRRAADLYGLDVIASDLQDRADNQTRFVAVVRDGGGAESGGVPAETARGGVARAHGAESGGVSAESGDVPAETWRRAMIASALDAAGGRIAEGAAKTMLIAETRDRPGALVALLRPFAERGVNLTKLESRPGEQPWTYRFFLELEGEAADEAVRAAIDEARGESASMKVLGSFPRI